MLTRCKKGDVFVRHYIYMLFRMRSTAAVGMLEWW